MLTLAAPLTGSLHEWLLRADDALQVGVLVLVLAVGIVLFAAYEHWRPHRTADVETTESDMWFWELVEPSEEEEPQIADSPRPAAAAAPASTARPASSKARTKVA